MQKEDTKQTRGPWPLYVSSPPFFFLTVFGDGGGDISWCSGEDMEVVEVSAYSSLAAEEEALRLRNESILLSMQGTGLEPERYEGAGRTLPES